MHMADALVVPAVATTMYLCSAVAGGYSVRQVRALNEPKKVPVMGVMGAFVFASFSITWTLCGISYHDRCSFNTVSAVCRWWASGTWM